MVADFARRLHVGAAQWLRFIISRHNGERLLAVTDRGTSFFELAARRRSVRHFQERPVPDECVRKLVETAMRAPTACNRQLWHFVAVTDPEVKDAMSRLGDSYSQSYLYDAPVIIAVFYDASMESRNPCHTAYITSGMAIYAILLAAEAQGLGAIYLGGIMDPRGIEQAVAAPAHLQNLGLICIGYPADSPPAPPARNVDDVLSYNQCRPVPPLCVPDVRPRAWNLRQLADFRDKILWYKGVAFDGRTVHVNPDPRFSPKMQYITHRLAMLIEKYDKPRLLDVLPFNGDLMIQAMLACPDRIESLHGYELTEGVTRYIDIRMRTLFGQSPAKWAVNDADPLHIPLPDESIDVISCYQRLGQFADPAPLLSELRRVLRRGGVLLTIDSNLVYPHMYWYKRAWKKNYALGRNWNFGPEKKLRLGQLRGQFKKAGFSIDNFTAYNPVTAKAYALLAGMCAKMQMGALEDRLTERSRQMVVTKGMSRCVSEILIHELEKV